MADDNGATESTAIWPLVKFQFSVTIGGAQVLCQEVTGLNSETAVIEYRVGNSKAYSVVKMPGIQKVGNVTLKKGVFKSDTKLWDMYNSIKMNTIERKTIVISLLDEDSKEAMSWNLTNAFPCKMVLPDMKADASESAVETLEIAYEGLTLVKAQ